MASFVFSIGHPFPAGTVVSAYEDFGQAPGGAPAGTALATGTVAANGALTISGLDTDGRYWAVALVGGGWRWVSFYIDAVPVDVAMQAEIDALEARTLSVESGRPTGVFNVKDSAYGAIGDDVADDAAAVTAAIDALNTAGGGRLVFPRGKYKINSQLPEITVSCVIEGDGAGTAAATAGSLLRFAAGVRGLRFGTASQHSALRDIYLRSSSTGAGADNGIECRGSRPRIDNVVVDNFGNDGVSLDTSAGGNVNLATLTHVRAVSNRRHGFHALGADSNVLRFIGCDAVSNLGWGFWNDVANCVYLACHTSLNTSGAFLDDGNSNQYITPYSESGTGHNVTLSGSSAVWEGGAYADPVITDSGTNNVIRRRGHSEGIVIGSGGSKIAKYLTTTTTWDPPSVAAGSFTGLAVTLTGATLGDLALASASADLTGGLTIHAEVTATDTLRVTLKNSTAGAIDRGSMTIRVSVIKAG